MTGINQQLPSEEEFKKAIADCQPLLKACSKKLYWHPVILQYLSLCNIVPVNEPRTTIRLSVMQTGAAITLKYNPFWLRRLIPAGGSMVAFLFGGEATRIALHHCTIRRLFPANVLYFASNLLVFENKTILDLISPIIQEQLNNIPTYDDIRDKIEPLGFDKSKMWYLEKLHRYINSLQESPEENSELQNDKDEIETSDFLADLYKNKQDESKNDLTDALRQYFNCDDISAAIATSEWRENDLINEQIRQTTNKIMSDANNWGNIPGNLKEMIIKANMPKFNPAIIVNKFRHEVISEEYYDTRSKVNRRHGFLLPGIRHKMTCSILFAEDVSGSMSVKDISIGQAFFARFIKHAESWFSSWDCNCSIPVKIKKIFINNSKGIDVIGRGGTNPQCIINMLEKEKLNFGGIVVFTDNLFEWPEPIKKWRNKIFIVGTGKCTEPPSWCKYFLKISDIVKYMEE